MTEKTTTQNEHNYLIKLRQLEAEGKWKPGTGLWSVEVKHDSWCGIYTGSYCNCDPHFYIQRI